MTLTRPTMDWTEHDAGHGGHDGAAAQRTRYKAGNSEMNNSRRTRSSPRTRWSRKLDRRSNGGAGRLSQQSQRRKQRRRRCFGGCGGQKGQSTEHKASRHQGEDETRPRKSQGRPWSAGHSGVHTTAVLPAARKKGGERRSPAKSSDQGWLARFARRIRS